MLDCAQGSVAEKFSGEKDAEKYQVDLSRCVVLSKFTPKESCSESSILKALRAVSVMASRAFKIKPVSPAARRDARVIKRSRHWQCPG